MVLVSKGRLRMLELHIYLRKENEIKEKIKFLKESLDIPIYIHIGESGENEIKGGGIVLCFFSAVVLLDEPHTELKEKVWGTNVREIWSGNLVEYSTKEDLLKSIKKRIKKLNEEAKYEKVHFLSKRKQLLQRT